MAASCFQAVDEFCFRSILRELDPPAAALLDSQAEVLLSSVLPLVSAVKLVLLLQPTSWCGTSMSHPADKMTAASRS